MVKQRFLAMQIFVYISMLVLVACAGQPTPPTETSEEQAGKAVKQAADTAVSEKVAEPPAQEPETPTIETIPRQEIQEPTVALKPLAVEEPAVSSEEKPSRAVEQETPVVSDVEPKVSDPVSTDTQVQEPPAVEPASEPVSEPVKEAEMAAEQPAEIQKPEVPAKAAPEPTVEAEIPSDPNTFLVTVGPKAAPHPSLGKGHAMGFMINGVSGKQIVLERGKTYTFDIQTDPKHDVYLSRKEIGWGASPLTEGVTGAYTYKGKMTFTPTESTPDKVYYSCRNHPHMGALIQIVNPGEKGDVASQSAVANTATPAKQASVALQADVSESAVRQKLMFAEMMVNSQGAKRVSASQNDEAKQLLVKAKAALSGGREKSLAGALPEALAKADESLRLMSEATRLVPSQEALAELAENYKSLLAEITDYQKSHKDNLERMERSGSVPDEVRYDEARVANLMSEARDLSGKNNYVRANAILGEVQKTITLALHKMLDSQTIVYDLNFETAEDEYDYEYKRYISYEELVPIAIEAKKPAPGAVKLMESFVEKARKRKDQAVEKAKAGEYPEAIAMLQQATTTVRRALRMVGVMQ